MSYDVFISHSAGDQAVAEAACDAIERAGYLCWLAPRDLARSAEPQAAGLAAIGASKVFLLVLSAESAHSTRVQREAARARQAGLAILPFRIEDAAPGEALHDEIAEAAMLDALQPPLQDHLHDLTALAGRLLEGGEDAPSRPLTVPPRPLPRPKRSTPSWLPIAAVTALGVVAIAVVAAVAVR